MSTIGNAHCSEISGIRSFVIRRPGTSFLWEMLSGILFLDFEAP